MTGSPGLYTTFAALYDRVARAPGVGRFREWTVRALAPPAGGTVVEFGCGTGANASVVRDRIGSEGRYVGVDLAPGVLRVARRREDGSRVTFLRGDAARPPIRAGSVDAALATFVVGMVAEPAAAVRRWAEVVESGGRLALCNFRRTTTPVARPALPAFRLFVRLGAPGSAGSPVERLDRRVTTAHETLREVCVPDSITCETALGGFLVLTAGTVA